MCYIIILDIGVIHLVLIILQKCSFYSVFCGHGILAVVVFQCNNEVKISQFWKASIKYNLVVIDDFEELFVFISGFDRNFDSI